MSKKPPKSNKKNNKKNNNLKNTPKNHEKLKDGQSYYSLDEEYETLFNIFKNLVKINNYKGLYITRFNSEYIDDAIKNKKIKTIILKQKKLDEIIQIIKNFISKKTKTVILLDRVDYLISNFSFNQFIKYLYTLTEIISETNSIFLLDIKTSFLDQKQISLIKNELLPIQDQKLEEIQIKSDYYEILKIINKYYNNNILVEFKKISDELSINRKTLSKKLDFLAKKGLILIKKSGRSKIPYLTDKAKMILNKNE
jgi:DNA-binding MarR family transcriptional regulator